MGDFVAVAQGLSVEREHSSVQIGRSGANVFYKSRLVCFRTVRVPRLWEWPCFRARNVDAWTAQMKARLIHRPIHFQRFNGHTLHQ